MFKGSKSLLFMTELIVLFTNLAFSISELHDDHSLEVMMRSKDMTVFERISSFYSAPFTKFMGNLVMNFIFFFNDNL